MQTPPELAAAHLSINLGALVRNWRSIAERVSPAQCGATIKANGYGCGTQEVAKALANAGCTTFFVALPMEGKQVRDILPDADIYILDGLFAGQSPFYKQHTLRPCLNSPDEIVEWAEATNGACPSAVHIDTGINRLGLEQNQAEELAANADLIKRSGISLLMSHLASGDDADNPANTDQLARFQHLRDLFPGMPASLANSPGTWLGNDYAHDLVRPGVALYGGDPLVTGNADLEPVVSLTAPILQVRHIQTGEGVGYGATWRADRPSRIALIGAGYADGIIRAMSWPAMSDGPALIAIAGQKAPIVGRVSMDMITVDVTDIPEDQVQRETQVELLGTQITVNDWAKWAGTIPYEILTSLGRRYSRVYVNE